MRTALFGIAAEAPNPKLQTPEKLQVPSAKRQESSYLQALKLVFEI